MNARMDRLILIRIVLMCLPFWVGLAHGETLDTETVGDLADATSLSPYLRYAVRNNAGLKAAFDQWKAEMERIPQAKSLPDPQFTYTYFVEEVETRVGPQRQKFGVMQMFPWFGTLRLRGDVAAQAAAAAEQAYRKAKLALFYRVKAAYHDYWYLAQAIAITKEHIQLVTNLESVARIRFTSGTAPNSAVIQAQVELGKLDDQLRSLEFLREPIAAKLNAAMNRPTHLPLPWPHILPLVDVRFTDDQAMKWLALRNPELEQLDHLVAQAAAGIRLAKKSYYPDIRLGVDYVDTGDALNASLADSGKDPIMAMVSVNVPLWLGKNRAAEREAALRKTAAEHKREDMSKTLEADLALALFHFRDAERKVGLYEDTLIPKATQSLEVAQQGFEAGKTSFISLIDAQRLLLEFQLAQRRAEADRGTRLAQIEMLTGKELDVREEQAAKMHDQESTQE